MSIGFFTRQSVAKPKRHSTRTKDPVETAQRMGPAAVRRMNSKAKTPEMEPWGDLDSDVLVMLDAPRTEDDKNGRPLSCSTGRQYKKWLTKYGDFAVDHLCRTLPPRGRGPNVTEIAAFESLVQDQIAAQQPKIIIACGHSVVKAFSPNIKYDIMTHRGRMFPVKIRDHECWVCPVIPPWQAEKIFEKGTEVAYGEEYERVTRQDLRAAFDLVDEPVRVRNSKKFDGSSADCIVCMKPDKGALREFLQEENNCKQTTYDIEGWRLRPYYSDFKMYSFSATGDRLTISMPFDHPEVQIRNMKKVYSFVEDFFYEWFEGRVVTAHNLIFDLEVFAYLFGLDILDTAKVWECTQVAAFCLDQRKGQSLDYLSRLYLGFSLKDLSPADLWAEKFAVRELLEYGAGDSKGTHLIRKLIVNQLKNEDMFDVWRFRCERIPALVQTQLRGLPVNQEQVLGIQEEYQDQLNRIEKKLGQDESVRAYEKDHGKFQPTAPEAVGLLYHEYLGHKEVLSQTKSGRGSKYSTGELVLSKFLDVEPTAKLILEHRRISRLLSTYLRRYLIDESDSYVFPDGRVHAQFSTTRADGGRLACEEPNLQNLPNRGEGKTTRKIFQ